MLISRNAFFYFAIFSLLTACSQAQKNESTLSGHFEDSSMAQLEPYRGRLSFVPEYLPGQNVIVSEEIFALAGSNMLMNILDAGVAKLYVVMVGAKSGEDASGGLKAVLRRRVEFVLAKNDVKIPPETIAKLDALFARIVPIEQESPLYKRDAETDEPTVWARDWSPLASRDATGTNYIMDLNYYPVRPVDDSTSRAFLRYFQSILTGDPAVATQPVKRVSLPIYNEGGNFMNTSQWCFMSERIVEANSKSGRRGIFFSADDARFANNKISADISFDKDALISFYNSFGCRNTQIFSRLPSEGTGHIDMWAKIVSEDTVLVSDLGDESIDRASTPEANVLRGGRRSAAEDIRDMRVMQVFLREKQQWFRDHGFRVFLLPMPTNIFNFDADEYKKAYDGQISDGKTPDEAKRFAEDWASNIVTRSYTNSLMVNGTLVTPRYLKFNGKLDYPDASLLDAYENKVRMVIEGVGLKVEFVETDALIAQGGSVHCTTMQVPW